MTCRISMTRVTPLLSVLALAFALAVVACSSSSASGNPDASTADVGAEGGANTDARSDDGGDLADSAACPAVQPSGSCAVFGQECSYGCQGCTCSSSGTWFCTGPQCPAFCTVAAASSPPGEGTACGGSGCCGSGIGETCDFTCADGGGHVAATCEAPGQWHVGTCAPVDAGADAIADSGADVATDAIDASDASAGD
jgi:hypothetical protein